MTRPILQWPDRRLRTKATPVEAVTDEIRAIWDEMIAVMRAVPGVGLAAPQLGVMLRLAVVDADGGRPVRMANPEVLDASAESAERREASPCLPGVSALITRPAEVAVRFLNEDGQVDRREWRGLWATSAQHQIDHLDGRMYFQRLSRVKRDMLLKKAGKRG